VRCALPISYRMLCDGAMKRRIVGDNTKNALVLTEDEHDHIHYYPVAIKSEGAWRSI